MRGLGWADFIAVGIAGAIAITLAMAAILVALRYFRPLATPPLEASPQLQYLRSEFLVFKGDVNKSLAAEAANLEIRFAKLEHADNLDLKNLLYFGVLQATAAQLDWLIADAPKEGIPLGADVDAEKREEVYDLHRGYVSKVLSQIDGHRYSSARNQMISAEQEAETFVRQNSTTSHINLLDLRRLEIARFQTKRMVYFLEYQRREIIEKIRTNRDHMLERYQAREKD